MKTAVISLSVTELQNALREYVERHAPSQPSLVLVMNNYDKTVLTVPLAPGAVVEGAEFLQQADI